MTVVRVANCAGWLWDRFSGLRDALAGPVDVVTGDYLAEPTLRQLALDKQRNPELGYALSFLAQFTDERMAREMRMPLPVLAKLRLGATLPLRLGGQPPKLFGL